ncbi:unnamed protein product [Lactuca saligna]|uniref:Uncharacterized protein n=1 Tax=Lactuca saligna TaxID=75948 RepID=A0AA35YVK0_LACSI|nr:unnamed protein product [Lactuca saligna]
MEEVRTLGIPVDIYTIDINVNMGEGVLTHEAHGISTVTTSSVPISIILSSTFETTTLDTSPSLPPFVSTIPTSLPTSTISSTFSNIMVQPITSLFSSQSTDGPKSTSDVGQDDDDYMVSFLDIQFDHEEENIPDHKLMFGKVFKILNQNLNSLLQLQDDVGNRNSVYGIEVDFMLKAQEIHLKALMEQFDMKNEKCMKQQPDSFVHEVKDLRIIAKDRHVLFVKAVKQVQEDVNLNIEEIPSEMDKEVVNLDRNYSTLIMKVDIVAAVAITNVVELHNSLIRDHLSLPLATKAISSISHKAISTIIHKGCLYH